MDTGYLIVRRSLPVPHLGHVVPLSPRLPFSSNPTIPRPSFPFPFPITKVVPDSSPLSAVTATSGDVDMILDATTTITCYAKGSATFSWDPTPDSTAVTSELTYSGYAA